MAITPFAGTLSSVLMPPMLCATTFTLSFSQISHPTVAHSTTSGGDGSDRYCQRGIGCALSSHRIRTSGHSSCGLGASMSDRLIVALIIGASIIVGAGLWGGRYSTSSMPQGGVYVVDRFTGDVRLCVPDKCRPVLSQEERELSDILHGKKSN